MALGLIARTSLIGEAMALHLDAAEVERLMWVEDVRRSMAGQAGAAA